MAHDDPGQMDPGAYHPAASPARLSIRTDPPSPPPYELSSLSPSRVLPPTPQGYYQLPLLLPPTTPASSAPTAAAAGVNAADHNPLTTMGSPRCILELWRDFDLNGNGGARGHGAEAGEGGGGGDGGHAPVQYVRLPPMGTWPAGSGAAAVARPNRRATSRRPSAFSSAAAASHDGGEGEDDSSRGAQTTRRRRRGAYRCRKCGGPKRAHDCPFACRQRSAGTQTNLAITGNGDEEQKEGEEQEGMDDGWDGDGEQEEDEEGGEDDRDEAEADVRGKRARVRGVAY